MTETKQAWLRRAGLHQRKLVENEQARDVALTRAREHGATYEACADVIGYSIEGVRRIINRTEVT